MLFQAIVGFRFHAPSAGDIGTSRKLEHVSGWACRKEGEFDKHLYNPKSNCDFIIYIFVFNNQIKRYPRTMADSVRTKDNKRAVKRQERKERKGQVGPSFPSKIL